jgi:cell division control protein 24
VPLLIPPQPSERINQQIKVHFNDDIFVLQVPISVDYTDLAAKLAKKIRLCDPNWDSTHLRIKYQDEDGDMVSLNDAEDMRMALESVFPGKVLTLSVK